MANLKRLFEAVNAGRGVMPFRDFEALLSASGSDWFDSAEATMYTSTLRLPVHSSFSPLAPTRKNTKHASALIC